MVENKRTFFQKTKIPLAWERRKRKKSGGPKSREDLWTLSGSVLSIMVSIIITVTTVATIVIAADSH